MVGLSVDIVISRHGFVIDTVQARASLLPSNRDEVGSLISLPDALVPTDSAFPPPRWSADPGGGSITPEHAVRDPAPAHKSG
jgi:hypothetical protein